MAAALVDKTLGAIEIGATAFWTGASAGFAAIDVPLAFRVLTDRDTIAELTGQTLHRLAVSTYVAGGLATGAALARAALDGESRNYDGLRALAGSAALVLIAYHEAAVIPAMREVKAAMGSFKDVAEDDPKRLAYRELHGRSTRVWGTALLLGVLQLGLAATRRSD
ncbi:MAG: DUF4149 domain-containing protein [Candidatus Baltobacteraceae bacterium]|jgi:hypothetical protein